MYGEKVQDINFYFILTGEDMLELDIGWRAYPPVATFNVRPQEREKLVPVSERG